MSRADGQSPVLTERLAIFREALKGAGRAEAIFHLSLMSAELMHPKNAAQVAEFLGFIADALNPEEILRVFKYRTAVTNWSLGDYIFAFYPLEIDRVFALLDRASASSDEAAAEVAELLNIYNHSVEGKYLPVDEAIFEQAAPLLFLEKYCHFLMKLAPGEVTKIFNTIQATGMRNSLLAQLSSNIHYEPMDTRAAIKKQLRGILLELFTNARYANIKLVHRLRDFKGAETELSVLQLVPFLRENLLQALTELDKEAKVACLVKALTDKESLIYKIGHMKGESSSLAKAMGFDTEGSLKKMLSDTVGAEQAKALCLPEKRTDIELAPMDGKASAVIAAGAGAMPSADSGSGANPRR